MYKIGIYRELGKDTYSSTKIAFAKDEKVTKQGKNGWSSISFQVVHDQTKSTRRIRHIHNSIVYFLDNMLQKRRHGFLRFLNVKIVKPFILRFSNVSIEHTFTWLVIWKLCLGFHWVSYFSGLLANLQIKCVIQKHICYFISLLRQK